MVVDGLSKQRALKTAVPSASPVDLSEEISEDLRLAQIWSVLRTHPLFVGLWSSQLFSSFLAFSPPQTESLIEHQINAIPG